MFERLQFYFRHSINDLRVNWRLTVFAVLCIGAGVAAIVSLQTLAVMIENSLTGSLRENNRGDIVFNAEGDSDDERIQAAVEADLVLVQETRFFGQSIEEVKLSPTFVDDIQNWAAETYPETIRFTYRQDLADPIRSFIGGGTGTPSNPANGQTAPQAQPRVIEPDVYPFFGEVLLRDGTPIGAVMNNPNDIVINDVLADELDVAVGAELRLGGAREPFVVRGIFDAEAEVTGFSFDTVLAGLYGGYFISFDALALFNGLAFNPDVGYLALDVENTTREQINELDDLLSTRYPFLDTDTTEDLRRNYETISENIDQLVTVMGLVSLLLGSIGIINTMQVVVRRRMLEIAVLKTIGLQGRQITLLFLTEALLMGVVGSIVGVLLGWVATFFIRGVAEAIFQSPLPFVFAPQPALAGLVVGTLVTVVFGLLPTLTASEVRPSVVLRPTERLVPRSGCLQTGAALVLMMALLSVIAQLILNDFTLAVFVVVASFIAAGAMFAVLRFIISLIARFFPSFGIVDLKLTLRQIFAGRTRAATTLLALVVGVFSLSLITLLAQSVNNILDFALTEATGGNVLINLQSLDAVEEVETILTDNPSVNGYDLTLGYNLEFVSLSQNGEVVGEEALRARLNAADIAFFGGRAGPPDDADDAEVTPEATADAGDNTEASSDDRRGPDRYEFFSRSLSSVTAVELPTEADRVIVQGRDLTAADAGEPSIVLANSVWIEAAGITPGDQLTFSFPQQGGGLGGLFGGGQAQPEDETAETITFTVVGIVDASFNLDISSSNIAPRGAFPDTQDPTQIAIIADVAEEEVNAVRSQISEAVPNAFVIEIAALTRFLEVLLSTFAAFPTLVALLGLIVGGVVIANSVALTTLERRKEIAIMKAVGLQRGRVLFMLLLENGFLGLIGGLIGVGFGLIGLAIFISTSGVPTSSIPLGTALLLMLLCVIVAISAALSAAYEAAGEKPLTVLRSE